MSATTYNAASQLDSLTFGNSAVTDYVYNSQNLRLTDIVTTKSGNTLLNLHYGFDNVGNILSVQDNARGETTNYSYDDLNRLLSASVTTGANQYSRAWTYDTIGNMQTRVENGVTTSYQYNDTTCKHAVTHLNNVLKYAYDANGNMTSRDGDTLAYDVENRLTQVIKGATTTNFAYNGDGTRVKREVVGVGTTYYIGNYFEVYVPNGGSATFNKYYYLSAQRVAAKIAGTLFYFQGDHLGSSSVVMTSAGTSFYSRQTYFPYGAPRTTEGSALPTDYTFTGQKNDDSTGLMFYGARYYDSALGRFTQPDTIVPSPLNPQSLNRFAYTYNNPVRYTDPTGHMACADECDPGSGGGDPADDPCYPNGCVIEPLPGGGLGEKNNNDGSIIVLPAEPQKLPVAQCGLYAIDCEEAYRAYNTSLALDSLTLKVAIAGEALGLGGAIAGAVLCTETGPGLVACAVGGYLAGAELAYFTTGLGGAALALVSTGFATWGDYNAGETRIVSIRKPDRITFSVCPIACGA